MKVERSRQEARSMRSSPVPCDRVLRGLIYLRMPIQSQIRVAAEQQHFAAAADGHAAIRVISFNGFKIEVQPLLMEIRIEKRPAGLEEIGCHVGCNGSSLCHYSIYFVWRTSNRR